MAETRRKFDRDFEEGAVRPIRETGGPIAQVAVACRAMSVSQSWFYKWAPGTVMRELGLAARPKKYRKATIQPGSSRWRAPDLIKRDFHARCAGRLRAGKSGLVSNAVEHLPGGRDGDRSTSSIAVNPLLSRPFRRFAASISSADRAEASSASGTTPAATATDHSKH
jgi:hypothetical protein